MYCHKKTNLLEEELWFALHLQINDFPRHELISLFLSHTYVADNWYKSSTLKVTNTENLSIGRVWSSPFSNASSLSTNKNLLLTKSKRYLLNSLFLFLFCCLLCCIITIYNFINEKLVVLQTEFWYFWCTVLRKVYLLLIGASF